MESWRRHGFPPGYRFVPKDVELIGLLATKLRNEPLPTPASVFHDVDVLACNPRELYDNYKKYMEDGYIYFFSERTFANPNGNKKRPTRATKHGGAWKASGASKAIAARDGVEIGRTLTMIYYSDRINEMTGRVEKACDKTELAMQEFTITQPTTGEVADLALYRIYMKDASNRRIKEGCVEEADDQSMDDGVAVSGGQSQCAGVVTAVYGQGHQFLEPCVPTWTAEPVTEGQQDERREVVNNEPAAMDDVPDQCYGPWSSLAQPYYDYPCAAPAAVPCCHLLAHQQPAEEGVYLTGVGYVGGYDSFAGAAPLESSSGLLAHQQPAEEGVYLTGVGYVGGYDSFAGAAPLEPSSGLLAHQQPAEEGVYLTGVGYVGGYDSFAGAAPLEPSSGLDTAAGVPDEQFGPIKTTQELVEQMHSAEPNAWSPNDLLAAEHCDIGTGNEDAAPPAES